MQQMNTKSNTANEESAGNTSMIKVLHQLGSGGRAVKISTEAMKLRPLDAGGCTSPGGAVAATCNGTSVNP